MTTPLRIAVIGAGEFGRQHIASVIRHPGATLHAVIDPSPVAQHATQQMVRSSGLDPADLISANVDDALGADACVVATPDHLHLQPALALLDSDHHLLIEKPLASTVEDAARLCEASERSGAIVAVGHLLRFDARLQWIRDILAADGAGQLVSLDLHRDGVRALNAVYPRLSPMVQGGVHDVDICEWLTGRRIVSVNCRSTRPEGFEVPISMTAVAELDGGGVATVRSSRTLADHLRPAPHTWLSATTTTLHVSMTDDRQPVLTQQWGADPYPPMRTTSNTIGDLLSRQLSSFLLAVRGGPTGHLASPRAALRAVTVAAAADQSANTHTAVDIQGH